jgi:hypothetical protein
VEGGPLDPGVDRSVRPLRKAAAARRFSSSWARTSMLPSRK